MSSIIGNLHNIQANILKPHGREFSMCIFIRFNWNVPHDAIKDWIKNISKNITSAKEQIEDSNYRRYCQDYDGGEVICFYFSASGLRKIGVPDSTIKSMGEAFSNGMKVQAPALADPIPGEWEVGYQYTIDAMILIADNNLNKVVTKKREFEEEFSALNIGSVLFTEIGNKLTLENENIPREHFGYPDGIGQLVLLDENSQPVEDNKDLVFDDIFGSFLVFRKYEQNVFEFNRKVRDLAHQLGISEEEAGAQVIGIFKDGTRYPSQDSTSANGSSYASSGTTHPECPMHSHRIKANPGSLVADSAQHQIVRRGVTYGHRNRLDGQPTRGSGLLFMCFQKNIGNQFEYIQTQWLNNENSPCPATGIDPIVGRSGSHTSQRWVIDAGSPDQTAPINFKSELGGRGDEITRMLGGEYFYAPPINKLISGDYAPIPENPSPSPTASKNSSPGETPKMKDEDVKSLIDALKKAAKKEKQ